MGKPPGKAKQARQESQTSAATEGVGKKVWATPFWSLSSGARQTRKRFQKRSAGTVARGGTPLQVLGHACNGDRGGRKKPNLLWSAGIKGGGLAVFSQDSIGWCRGGFLEPQTLQLRARAVLKTLAEQDNLFE